MGVMIAVMIFMWFIGLWLLVLVLCWRWVEDVTTTEILRSQWRLVFRLLRLTGECHLSVEQSMQGLASLDGCLRVNGLKYLCEGIEQRPSVPGHEVLVGWLAPFLEDAGHLAGGNSPTVYGSDDEIVG